MKISKLKKYLFSDGQPTRLLSFLAALFLVVLVFNNVVFRHASLSMLDLANITGKIRQMNSAHPENPYDCPHYGFSDTGGAAFQSEPMQQFMKYSFYSWQSPYWNPYVATGALGPETLVDNKFSPFTLLVAVLGGSSIAFHLVLLFLYIIAIYFLIRLIVCHLRLGFLSALVAAVVYLLGGYSVANLSSNVAQVYLYFPILLFALCSFGAKPNFFRFFILVLSNVLIMLTTFLPTVFLTLLTAYLIATSFIFDYYILWKHRFILLSLQIFSALLAFLLLSFLWFPLLEGAGTLGLFSMYQARVFYPANLGAFLSFFTPKHFWESYNATPSNILQWFVGNVIFHFGIVASMVVALIFAERKNFRHFIIWILFILSILCLGRIFAVPGIYQIFGALPVLKNIGEQYLWIVVAYSFTLLSAFGMESLKTNNNYRLPILAVLAIIFSSIGYLIYKVAAMGDFYFEKFGESKYYLAIIFYLGMIFLIIIAAVVIFYFINKKPAKIILWKTLLVLLVFLELFYYMNTLRYVREDVFKEPPSYISFLKANIGNNRLASYSWGASQYSFAFNPELGAAYQIQQVESLNYVLPWYKKFYERNFQTPNDRWGDFSLVFGQKDEPNIRDNILDLLSIKYILTDEYQNKYRTYFADKNYPLVFTDGIRYIFENTDVYPRVMAVTSLIKESLTPDTQGYSPRDVVFSQDDKLFEEAQKAGVQIGGAAVATNPANQVNLVSYENAKIIIDVKLATPAIITLMDNWHPNWRAFANDKEVYIGKINESFRGMALPAGDYRLELTYQPKTLKLGLILAGLTAMGLLILFFFRRRYDKFLSELTNADEPRSPKSLNPAVSFSVVVPAYNEEKNIQNCVQTILRFLKKLKNKTGLIIVNDGSTDGTLKKLELLRKKYRDLQIVNHLRNKGYGAANISGGKLGLKMGYDYVLFMDADLTQNVTYLHAFVREMERGTDFIKATRYREGGGTRGVPLGRRLVSRIGNLMAKIVFRLPLSDYTNGFRAVKTRFFAKINCREKGFSYLIEEVYCISKQAKTYAEVPYILTARSDRFSQSKFNYSLKVYFNYLKYLFRK